MLLRAVVIAGERLLLELADEPLAVGVPHADLAVPDADRRVLRMMTVAGGSLREITHVALDRPIVTAIGTLDAMDNPTFVVGLEDGRLIAISKVEPPKKKQR